MSSKHGRRFAKNGSAIMSKSFVDPGSIAVGGSFEVYSFQSIILVQCDEIILINPHLAITNSI